MTNKFFSNSLGWLRKSLTDQESLPHKQGRSQSIGQQRPQKAAATWVGQHSFDGVLSLNSSFDEDKLILDSKSSIFSKDDAEFLSRHLPARLVERVWHLAFSTETHGFSLSTIYRVAKEHDPELKHPVLLAIRDIQQHRFGAYLSESPKVVEKCFGSGETFVFQFDS